MSIGNILSFIVGSAVTLSTTPLQEWIKDWLYKRRRLEEKKEQNIQEAALLAAQLRKWPNKLQYHMSYVLSLKLLNGDSMKLPKYDETLPDPRIITKLSYLLTKLQVNSENIIELDNIEKNFSLFITIFSFSVIEPVINNQAFDINQSVKECIELIKNSKLFREVSIKECIEGIGDNDPLKAGTLLYIKFQEYVESIITDIKALLNPLQAKSSASEKN